MNLQQDIEFLKMFTFNSIEEMNKNIVLQKYFDIKEDGKGAIEHIFKGYKDSWNYFSGYHTEILYPALYNPILEDAQNNKNKVYEMYLLDVKKRSTFFPISMSCEDVIICILQAYNKKIESPMEKTFYIDDYKIEIEIALTDAKKIYTAYPLV